MNPATRWAIALGMLAMSLGAVRAARAVNDVTIVVHAGDDVEEMVARLTGGSATLEDIRAASGLEDGADLVPGQRLTVPAHLLAGWADTSAELLFYRGEVALTAADGSPLPVGVGIPLHAGDRLITGADSTVSLRLVSASESLAHEHVVIQSNSDVTIQQLLFQEESGDRNVILSLLKGALEVITSHSSEGRRTVEVDTPTAVGGVRGTRFRAVIEGEGAEPSSTRFETLESTVMVASEEVDLSVDRGFGTRVRSGAVPDDLHPLPEPPAPRYPADGAVLEEFLFRWDPAPDAAAYVLEIAVDEEFHVPVSRMLVDGNEAAPAQAVLEVRDAPYYWRVSTVDGDGFQGLTSPPRRVVVRKPKPRG